LFFPGLCACVSLAIPPPSLACFFRFVFPVSFVVSERDDDEEIEEEEEEDVEEEEAEDVEEEEEEEGVGKPAM